jgi:hypothetical protein
LAIEALVVRGGSRNNNAHVVRAANRGGYAPGARSGNLGFRCVLGQSEDCARDERRPEGCEAEPRPSLV